MRQTTPNNGMHPTPHHAASHVRCAGARVMPGVRRINLKGYLDGVDILSHTLSYH
jgi:hypothetical protein